MTDQTPYWIALSRVTGIGPARMRLLLDYFESPEAAWNALYADLLEAGLDPKTTEALAIARRDADRDTEMARLDKTVAPALTSATGGYPKRRRALDNPPPVPSTL